MVKLKKSNMATEIREELVIINNEGKEELTVFYNKSGGITLMDDTDPSNMYAFYISINKEDWEVMRSFIDNQFKD